jgi:hypothetical protein
VAPYGLDDAGALVTEHERHRDRIHRVAHGYIGVAAPHRHDPDPGLVGTQVVELEVLDVDLPMGFARSSSHAA